MVNGKFDLRLIPEFSGYTSMIEEVEVVSKLRSVNQGVSVIRLRLTR